jgi:NAD(P)-dependent dehydrogenase (short-subunit alcohol dehydrogenase family)
MDQPANRAVVITGASTGIGAACALALAREGWRVYAGVRRPEDGERLRQAAGPAAAALVPLVLDVTDEPGIAAAAGEVARAEGERGLAGLVNNAGIAVGGPLEFLPVDVLRRQFEINVIGQIAVTQAFLPLLRRAPGRIVNMSSISGRMTVPFMGPYSASKFALEALSDALRVELRPWGLHVAVIEPGRIATPIWEKSLAAHEELLRRLPAATDQLYGPAIAGLLAHVREIQHDAAPVELVVAAVRHALSARRPRQRYPVGRGAWLARLFNALPGGLRDEIIARRLPRYPDETRPG